MARRGKFAGIPAGSAQEAKLERCVKRVKLQGRDKSSAIAICRAAMKRKELAMTGKSKKDRQKEARRRRRENKRLREKETTPVEEPKEEEVIEETEDEEEEFSDELTDEELASFDLTDDEKVELANLLEDDEDEFVSEEEDIEIEDDEPEEVDEDEELEADAEEDVAEAKEKHFGEAVAVVPTGPTSFEELESAREAREAASAIRNTSWDAEMIIGNIINMPTMDPNEKASAITKAANDLKSRLVTLSGKLKARRKAVDKQPSKKNRNGFIIQKDVNGDYRWVAWVTNNYKDKEGEILSEASHKEFITWAEGHPKWYVDFLPWHNKAGAFTHPVDSWMYKKGFMIYSGKLEEIEAKVLMHLSKKERLGMSHGFIPLQRNDEDINIIEKYRTYEVSVLPLHNAANPYTNLEVVAKELSMSKQEDFLREVLGEERFKILEDDAGAIQKILDDAGVDSKETKPKDEEEPKTKENAEIMALVKELGLEELSEWVANMTKESKTAAEERKLLVAAIKDLSERLEAKEKDIEDQMAEIYERPPAALFAWQEDRPSQSKETIADEDDKILKQVPGLKEEDWLSKASGTVPLTEPGK